MLQTCSLHRGARGDGAAGLQEGDGSDLSSAPACQPVALRVSGESVWDLCLPLDVETAVLL